MALSAKKFFTSEQQDDIKQAVLNAELDTSGEIRVHIENKCAGDVLIRAAQIFKKLKMDRTELHNGVLIYLAIENRKFAIIGDAGIDAVVPENFWEQIKTNMLNLFREGQFAKGLSEAILAAGAQLKQHFPHLKNDVNELPDDISFGSK
ncbi:MAG: TPM domain-containing protein [Bacteroidales bacterium]